MTEMQFMQATGVAATLAERWFHPVIRCMEKWHIDTSQRQAYFLAQIGVESGGFCHVEESFNYSIDGLKIFGSRLHPHQRETLGRAPGQGPLSKKRQSEIAELVYGGRLGNNRAGDGWKYRGRGLKQITFRSNYTACSEALNVDLINDPDLLLQVEYAADSAGWFWHAHGCNRLADSADVASLTRKINGGFNGLQARIQRTDLALKVLKGGLLSPA